MARTAPIPNIPAIPGMNPGVFVLGGGGGSGSGDGSGDGSGNGQGADGQNGGDGANGGGRGACGAAGSDGRGCPNHHGGSASGGSSQGDPVDVITGRVWTLPSCDLRLGGPLPLVWLRSYSSHARRRDVGHGPGWAHSLAWEIEVERRRLRLWTGNGVPVEFERLEEGDSVLGPNGWLLVKSEGSYVLDDAQGRYYLFERADDHRHLLSAIKDAHGNRVDLHHEAGCLVAITDSVGRRVRVERSRDGTIARLSARNADHQGQWITFHEYAYESGQLAAATDAAGHSTRYAYARDALLATQVLPTGFSFHYRYDDADRCVETWGEPPDPGAILASDVPATLADGRTRARGLFHLVVDYMPGGYREVTTSLGLQRLFGNEHGKADRSTLANAVFSRTYDDAGNVLTFTDPLGRTTRYERDARGRLLTTTDALGRQTIFEREPDGHIRRAIDPGGGVTEIRRGDRQLSWTDPAGFTFEIRIDPRGLVTETVGPSGARTRFEHDAHGNRVRRIDVLGHVTAWEYDYFGRCVARIDPDGARTVYFHDARGLLVAVREPDGGTCQFAYDGLGQHVATAYPEGGAVHFRYGAPGLLSSVRAANGEGSERRYDREGRLCTLQNERGEVHSFEHDARGLLTREVGFDGAATSYAYDLAGQLTKITNAAGDTLELVYDDAGQLVKRIRSDDVEEQLEYDERGALIACTTDSGRFEYVRNPIGWVVEERHIVDGQTFRVRRKMDPMGNAVQLETSLGLQATFAYDPRGRLVNAALGETRLEMTHDPLDRELERRLAGGARLASRYDAAGRLVDRSVLGRSARRAGPDEPDWVGLAEPPLVQCRYTWNHDGKLTARERATRSGSLAERFVYDARGRLTAAGPEAGRGAAHFAYDAAGNLFEAEPGAPERVYGPGNRLLRSGNTVFRSDEAGRLIETVRSEPDGDERRTSYEWDAVGMLRAVEKSDGLRVELAYDPFARRTEKRVLQRTADGAPKLVATVRYVWDGSALVHEIKRSAEAAGDPVVEVRSYVFRPGRLEPLAQRDGAPAEAAGEWLHFVSDDLGHPEALVRDDGSVAAELDRSGYRIDVEKPARATTPIRFRGQYEDEETGLYYNRHRYYDPALGRYISPDPAGLSGGLNAFEYANGSPTTTVDPRGLMPFTYIRNAAGADPSQLPERRRDQDVDYTGRSQGERNRTQEARRDGYRDPAITTAVANAQRARGVTPTGDTTCAEVDALHQMAHDIRTEGNAARRDQRPRQPPMTDDEVRAELQQRFRNGATAETNNGAGQGMAPCPMCAQIFRELGLHPANIGDGARGGVMGPNDRRDVRPGERMDRWDGRITQPSETPNSRQTRETTVPSRTPPFAGT